MQTRYGSASRQKRDSHIPANPVKFLLGRDREKSQLDQLLVRLRAGQGSAMVLRGESGIGKTALLEYVMEKSQGCRTERATGVETESNLPFAGLHQLCEPMLDLLEHLPAPQRSALRATLGMSDDTLPDQFLTDLAVLGLFVEAGKLRPLVCLVDDLQWMDRDSIHCLAFVARRLTARRVALVFAEIRTSDEAQLVGVPELLIKGVGDREAHALLASRVHGALDVQVRDRIVAEAHGNPLEILQFPRDVTPAVLAGGFALPGAGLNESRLETNYVRRLRNLPKPTQQLLLIAAADSIGDPLLLWRAANVLGIPTTASAPAEADELVRIGVRVTFTHPLARVACYRNSTALERQRVHAALAESTDSSTDYDRRAWHLAHAVSGPDEGVAAELERSVDLAERRGGVAAAAAFLERSTELTSDSLRRGERALAAAGASLETAALDATDRLLATAAMCPLDTLQEARLLRLRAQSSFARTRGVEALPLLLEAAKRLEPLDLGLSREAYLEALWAAVRAGRFGGHAVLETAVAASTSNGHPLPLRTVDMLLDALVVRFTEGYCFARAALERALAAFLEEDLRSGYLVWCWLACQIAMDLWDDEACAQLTTNLIQTAREVGVLSALPFALSYMGAHMIFAGDFAAAEGLINEADAITTATYNTRFVDFSVLLAAWRGDKSTTLELIEVTVNEASERGEGFAVAVADWATSVLNNGLGEFQEALVAAKSSAERDDLGFGTWILPELVEAAARSGQLEIAADALERLSERTGPSGGNWARATEAAARALLSNGEVAEHLYLEAISRFARTRVVVHLARAHLIYGEWLRRENRRVDARKHLREAVSMFDSMGATAFAGRARRELFAAGDVSVSLTHESCDELTTQEAHIAQLARDGFTNSDIGKKLFISPRTVQYHLHKVFRKLDITSREQLRVPHSRD